MNPVKDDLQRNPKNRMYIDEVFLKKIDGVVRVEVKQEVRSRVTNSVYHRANHAAWRKVFYGR